MKFLKVETRIRSTSSAQAQGFEVAKDFGFEGLAVMTIPPLFGASGR